ncbi:hypothetical protein KIN20_017157 [Parelaphostrongylus tenuis]|uniref:Uncharacterized protein n=1 Tax=Parelaphostrongylus tenuis TaxID=148309 RepID=A0AAD5N0H9_PARTN|nr:hypothetical protein KIN20_017157 [Parelaphostrongylus tenuis]
MPGILTSKASFRPTSVVKDVRLESFGGVEEACQEFFRFEDEGMVRRPDPKLGGPMAESRSKR